MDVDEPSCVLLYAIISSRTIIKGFNPLSLLEYVLAYRHAPVVSITFPLKITLVNVTVTLKSFFVVDYV